MAGWPQAAPFGVTLSFDFDAEEVWIGEDPTNAHRPGVLSQGTFGPRVAMPLLLKLLDRHRVPATFFIPGADAERHPSSVLDIVRAGHEIAHHGYTHRSPSELEPSQERAELVRGLDILRGTGAEVVGYRSPSWDFSDRTLDLLEEFGFEYSSNLMDDIRPYRHTTHPLVEIPVSWVLDDAPHFWFAAASWDKTIRSPREVEEVWLAEIDAIGRLGAHVMLTMHPQIIGRPSRLEMLDRILTHLSDSGAWFGTARQTASLVP
ncbi:MAG: polysaccharide deacetylase family protein [Microbacteriaceae bacterium]